MEADAQYIDVKHGGRHLPDSNQFEYRVTKKKPTKTYYQCIMRKHNACPAVAVVNNVDNKIISVSGEHTHDSDLLKRKVRAIEKEAIKDSSGNLALNPRAMLGNITNKIMADTSVEGVEEVICLQYDLLKPSFEEDSETVDKFLEYFEKTWIGSLNWRTGARKNPMFPHAVWNKYNSVLSEDPLTSNAAEGYNSALALSLPKNASIRALVQQLRTEETSISRKMRDALLGAQNNAATANTSRNLGRMQRRIDLKNLVYPATSERCRSNST